MDIKKVLISDSIDPVIVNLLRDRNLEVDLKTNISNRQLIDAIKEYDALVVRSGTHVTADIINSGNRLKLIGRAGVGVDNIDCDAARKKGITVINAPAGNTLSAAELTCGMILALSRNIPAACSSLKSGLWNRKIFMGSEVAGKTLAIIGLGRIGKEVAARMQAFEMKTIGYDPFISAEDSLKFNVKSYSLDEIWPIADYITVHVPLLPSTKNLICKETLKKCKKGVKIINVARGGVVREDDLLQAIRSGQCGGAGLDVFTTEPPVNSMLLENPSVVCTPHLGASTKEAQTKVAAEIGQQILDLIDGKRVAGLVK